METDGRRGDRKSKTAVEYIGLAIGIIFLNNIYGNGYGEKLSDMALRLGTVLSARLPRLERMRICPDY